MEDEVKAENFYAGFGPYRADGPNVFLPVSTGGFFVGGCPNSHDLAQRIATSLNAMRGIKDPEGFMREAHKRIEQCVGILDNDVEIQKGSPMHDYLRALLSQMEAREG